MKALLTLLALSVSASALAQPAAPAQPPPPPKETSGFHDAVAAEIEDIKNGCSSGGFKVIATCGAVLATGQPFHLSFGTLAPQSGLGLGVAAVAHKNFVNSPWRFHGNGDVVGSFGGSWRAGAYFNFDHIPDLNSSPISVTFDDPDSPDANEPYRGTTVYSTYVQAISLNDLLFFGLGPDSPESTRSRWHLSEKIVGGKVDKPVRSGRANLALVGAVNGRFVDVESRTSKSEPAIGDLFGTLPVPGLAVPSAQFIEFSEGVRLEPSWFGRRVYPSYTVSADQFISDGSTKGSFNRLTVDLEHEFPLYKTSRSSRRFTSGQVGPDECSPADDGKCAPVTRNRDGAVSVRLLTTLSWARDGNTVPFYFQPTLGGSDINGSPLLNGFDDYRFRAPNMIALRERFDHSLGFWDPLGFVFIAEQGKVALERGDVSLSGLEHSVATGLTIRAGGFPQVLLLFGWSREGYHIGLTINPSLLGGATRPSLF